ncbi:hypothetical protein GW17_00058452, partial [Ensete ventricosum]
VSKSKKPRRSKRAPATAIGNGGDNGKRSSAFRGVTRHRWTGRFEAHLWDKHCWNPIQNKKGRQASDIRQRVRADAEHVEGRVPGFASAQEQRVLKRRLQVPWGCQVLSLYTLELVPSTIATIVDSISLSRSNPNPPQFDRHHHNGRWEARIGRVLGNKYLYLGTFGTPLSPSSSKFCLIHVFSACSSAPHVDGESSDSVGGPATHLFVLCSPETTTSPCMVSLCASHPPLKQASWARFLEHHTFLIRWFPVFEFVHPWLRASSCVGLVLTPALV